MLKARKFAATTAVITALLTVIAATPAVASPTLNGARARNMAGSFAMSHWSPWRVLPDYSQATRWDEISDNSCTRFSRTRVDCVVSVDAQDYYYDSVAEENTGYAYCVGSVTVRMNRWGRVSVWAQGFEPAIDCDSTNDFDD